MYYRLYAFYKRDTYFWYSEDKNPIDWIDLRNGRKLNFISPIIYNVDRLDNYINNYDILPSDPLPLVSKKFKTEFENLLNNREIQFFESVIIDEKGQKNEDFYSINILNVFPCLDERRSVFTIDEDNYYEIKKAYIKTGSLEKFSIIRMEEHKSYIIVTEEFKKQCENAKLKGFHFIPEGYSIYTEI